jgi:2-haloacid dehalogenase
MAFDEIKALTFDVFGTVVDWRTSVSREAGRIGADAGIIADWEALADRWRAGYQPSMARVRRGALPWTNFDDLHRISLVESLDDLAIAGFDDAALDALNRAWRRLDPWPDAVSGLTRLKRRFVVATLSNGNVSQLVEIAKHGNLPWDVILSAELMHHYKPDPEVYLGAAELLSLDPAQVMMVAAHPPDLAAARAVGFRSAFVSRTHEHGAARVAQAPTDPDADITATDFNDLADQLAS